jgi:hypothetical protein
MALSVMMIFCSQRAGAEERDGGADGDEGHERSQPGARFGDVERPHGSVIPPMLILVPVR